MFFLIDNWPSRNQLMRQVCGKAAVLHRSQQRTLLSGLYAHAVLEDPPLCRTTTSLYASPDDMDNYTYSKMQMTLATVAENHILFACFILNNKMVIKQLICCQNLGPFGHMLEVGDRSVYLLSSRGKIGGCLHISEIGFCTAPEAGGFSSFRVPLYPCRESITSSWVTMIIISPTGDKIDIYSHNFTFVERFTLSSEFLGKPTPTEIVHLFNSCGITNASSCESHSPPAFSGSLRWKKALSQKPSTISHPVSCLGCE